MSAGLGSSAGLTLLLLAAAALSEPTRIAVQPRAVEAPTFERDVLPILQQKGCASAYCHGSATGQAGFKLSLFGSDPDADWRALVVDLDGRRLDWGHPESSLLLKKPSLTVPHEGGERLPREGPAYAAVRGWIAAGAQRGEAAGVTGLELRRAGLRVRATATFADGGERDVTGLAVLRSSDPRVVTVDEAGRLALGDAGEAFVLARYAGTDAVLRVLQPVTTGAPGRDDLAHPLDRAFGAHLARLGLGRGPRADARVLLRRLYLDLAGRTPTAAELATFPAAGGAEGMAATAAALTAGPDFSAIFGAHLCRWLEVPDEGATARGGEAQARALRRALHEAVATGRSLHRVAEDALEPGHPLVERFADPRDRAEYAARAFLGIRLGCARCHDHPLDRWRQQDHLAFSSLLATRRDRGGVMGPGVCYDDEGRPVAPRLLPLSGPAPADRDAWGEFRWLALEGTDAFARTFCNHLLGTLLGRAPVEPADDHRPTNPARFGGVLDATVAEYRRTGGDLRAVVRWIVSAELYAASSEPRASQEHDDLAARHLARCTARVLEPATWRRAVLTVLATDGPDTPPSAAPLADRLHMENGAFLAEAVAAPGNVLDRLVERVAGGEPEAALAELFERAICRAPRADEVAVLLPALSGDDPRTGLQTVAKALFLSREFGSRR